jgi:hypothetical protein
MEWELSRRGDGKNKDKEMSLRSMRVRLALDTSTSKKLNSWLATTEINFSRLKERKGKRRGKSMQ